MEHLEDYIEEMSDRYKSGRMNSLHSSEYNEEGEDQQVEENDQE